MIKFIKRLLGIEPYSPPTVYKEGRSIRITAIYNLYEVTTPRYYGLQGFKKEKVYIYSGKQTVDTHGLCGIEHEEPRLPSNYKLIERCVEKPAEEEEC